MRAIVLPRYGGPEVMRLMEAPDPEAGPAEIVVNVAYTALNRADMLQRMGKYPPPKPLGRNPSLGGPSSVDPSPVGSPRGGSPSAHFAGGAVAPATPDPEIPGLEFSGVVEKVGARVERWRPGDRVFGLLPGGRLCGKSCNPRTYGDARAAKSVPGGGRGRGGDVFNRL